MVYIDKTRLMQRIHTGMTLNELMQEIIDAPRRRRDGNTPIKAHRLKNSL